MCSPLRARKSRPYRRTDYLAAGLTLVLFTAVVFLLCFLVVLAFEVALAPAAGAGAAGVCAARMAPTLKREAKISLFIWFSFFACGSFPPRITILQRNGKINNSPARGVQVTKVRGESGEDLT